MNAAGSGAPSYVITGRLRDRPDRTGEDDWITAQHIETVRRGALDEVDPSGVARRVAASDEAARTLALGPDHVHPEDIALAVDVDRFPFAMEVTRDSLGLRLDRVDLC